MKNSLSTELEKLKKMNGRDRVWYIAEYYRFHIIALILGIILIYVVGSTAYRMTFRDALHVLCINSRSEESTNLAPLEEDYAAWMNFGKKDVVYAETLFISYGDDATEYSLANLEKIAALTMAQELDVMICDTESLDHFAAMGAFADLEEALPPELLASVSDRLYRTEDTDGRQCACAIDLSGTQFAEDSVFAQDPPLLAIIVNSKRSENALGLVRYIFQ